MGNINVSEEDRERKGWCLADRTLGQLPWRRVWPEGKLADELRSGSTKPRSATACRPEKEPQGEIEGKERGEEGSRASGLGEGEQVEG